jgi:hypothetical protein
MSLRLLAFIGRRLQAWRLLLVVTARAEELEGAPLLQKTLAELDREPHVATVDLEPLSRIETVHLVRALAPGGSDDVALSGLSEQVWHASRQSARRGRGDARHGPRATLDGPRNGQVPRRSETSSDDSWVVWTR